MEQMRVADSKAIQIVEHEPDPKLTDNALRVLGKRYLKKDDRGRVIETPKELSARVAWNLAQAERNYGADDAQVEEAALRFYRIIANLDFLPNSPTLMNAGLELQLPSASFVIPVHDGSGYSHALIAQDNGPAEVLRIETDLGFTLDATYNHAIAIVDNSGQVSWREAAELRPGDWILVVKGGHVGRDISLPPIGSQHWNATPLRVPERMNADLSEILGLYMADGCTSSGGRFIFTVGTIDLEVADRIRVAMQRCFGLAPNRITPGRGGGGYVDIQFQSRDLVRWLERLGWIKGSSPNAFVPSEILGGSAETARAFVRGLFEGDGHVHSSSGYPCLSTTSPRLATEVQQLLLALGMVARRTKIDARARALGHKPVHILTIVDEDSVRRFAGDIGFIGDRKQDHLENGQRPRVNTSDVVPNQAGILRSMYSFV